MRDPEALGGMEDEILEEAREPESEPFVEDDQPAPAAEREQTPRLPAPINWWTLPPVRKQILVENLDLFVQTLTVQYELDDWLRPCWFKHPAIIQELIAFWQWRNQQQYIAQQIPQAALDFHIQLGPFIERVRDVGKRRGCGGLDHRDWKEPAVVKEHERDAAEISSYWGHA